MWIVNTKWLKLAYCEDPKDNMPGEQYSGLIFCVIEIAFFNLSFGLVSFVFAFCNNNQFLKGQMPEDNGYIETKSARGGRWGSAGFPGGQGGIWGGRRACSPGCF